MSMTELTPTLIFEFGRSAVYLMAILLGILLPAKCRRASLMCVFGGLLAVYAMFAARVICDAMWEAVRYDRTVEVARDITFGVRVAGSVVEVLGLAVVVLAVFVERKRGLSPPAATTQTTSIASP